MTLNLVWKFDFGAWFSTDFDTHFDMILSCRIDQIVSKLYCWYKVFRSQSFYCKICDWHIYWYNYIRLIESLTWKTFHCFDVCTVNDLSTIRCNSSIFLDTTNSTLYISGVHDIDQPHGGTSGNAIGAGSVPSSAVAFYNSCPLHVRARPRQSINFTLYSFGHYLDHDDTDSTTGLRFCSANLFIAEGQRRHSSPLCPARQRQRNLYLSHDSILTLYFSQQPRKLLNSFNRWTFILKIECKSNKIWWFAILNISRYYLVFIWWHRFLGRLRLRGFPGVQIFCVLLRNI